MRCSELITKMEALLQEKGRLQDFISGSCSGKPTQSGSIDKKHHSLGQSSLSVAGGNSPALPLSVTENVSCTLKAVC